MHYYENYLDKVVESSSVGKVTLHVHVLRYTGRDWISLVEGGGDWEVRVKGNLTARPDTGIVNSSPISSMSPIVRLLRGCNHTIVIPGKSSYNIVEGIHIYVHEYVHF